MSARATQVRERPILFSGEMVRAILDGRKTQTRRVVKPQPEHPHVFRALNGAEWLDDPNVFLWDARWADDQGGRHGEFVGEVRCPYGQPGDRLWVREAWAAPDPKISRMVAYRADGECGAWLGGGGDRLWSRHGGIIEVSGADGPSWGLAKFGGRWRPSIHMPRWASRLTLEITEVRVERVQEITEEDARAEGFTDSTEDLPELSGPVGDGFSIGSVRAWHSAKGNFQLLWDSLNASRGFGWDANPWAWVVSFRLATPEGT